MTAETRFAPHPWKYTLNVGPTRALIVESDGSTIVELRNNVVDSRFKNHVCLFTAAPELYAALKLFVERCDAVGMTGRNVPFLPAARQAIAKAEGRLTDQTRTAG